MEPIAPEQAALAAAHVEVAKAAAYLLVRRRGIPLWAINDWDQDDLEAVAMEELCKLAQQWSGEGNFGSYAAHMLPFRLIDWMRTVSDTRRSGGVRRPTTFSLDAELVEGEGLHMMVVDPNAPGDDTVLQQDNLIWLMEQLPERERYVVWMHTIEGYRMYEIAEVLGVTEGRVSQLHLQAMMRLRRNTYASKKRAA